LSLRVGELIPGADTFLNRGNLGLDSQPWLWRNSNSILWGYYFNRIAFTVDQYA